MINKEFIWFIGVIVNVSDDPHKAGYVQVRNVFEQAESDSAVQGQGKSFSAPDSKLPWAQVLMPITTAGLYGVGTAPLGMTKGSRVLCFYMDSPDKNLPVVMGVLPNMESISPIAQGKGPVQKQYLDPVEPSTPYAAQYPYNKTLTTQSGHVIEIDDTPSAERLHIYHRNGSYVEFDQNGNIITRAQGESREIVGQKKIIFTQEGDIVITADSGQIVIDADGDVVLKSTTGAINIQAPVVGLNA